MTTTRPTPPNFPPEGKPVEEWTKAEHDAFWQDQNDRAKRIHGFAEAGMTPWAEVSEMMTTRQWYRIQGFVKAAVEMADYFGDGCKVEVTVERVRAARKYSPNDRWAVQVKATPVTKQNPDLRAVNGWAHIGKHGAVNGRLWDLFSEKNFGDVKPIRRKRSKKA